VFSYLEIKDPDGGGYMSNTEVVIDSVRLAIKDYRRRVILKEKGGERYLTMLVDDAGADAVAAALQAVRFRELYTWNPLGATASNLRARLKHVLIDKLEGEKAHAKALLEKEGIIEISCKMSDALAGAARAGVPIFVDEEILSRSGITTA
jgi:bifunctional DNase/RNase